MKVYLAAAFERKRELQGYRQALIARGLVCTSRWLDEPAEEGLGTDLGYGAAELATCAWQDLCDVLASDVLVVFSGGAGRGGRHVETGVAIAMEIPVLLVGERENVFHYLPDVECIATWDLALPELVHRSRPRPVEEPAR